MDWVHPGKHPFQLPEHTDQERRLYDEADARRRARNVLIIALALTGLSLALLVSAAIRAPSPRLMAILSAAAACFTGTSLLALRDRTQLAAILLVLAPLLLVVLDVSGHGQLRSSPYFCSVSVVIAGMIMRPRGMALTSLGALATVAVLGALSAGVTQILPPPGSSLINAALLIGLLALVAALGVINAAHSWHALQARERQAHQAEQALRESEDRYRLIAEHTSDLIALLDTSGRYLYASPSYAHELGHPPDALIGASRCDLIHQDDLPAALAHWHQAQLHGSAQGSYRVAHADGTWRWLEVRLTAAARKGERYIVLVARDISQRRVLEAQFQQAQKLEALGRLASSIAHDFNNLLVVIKSGAEMAADTLPADHIAREDLDAIQHASKRAVGLTRQLLAFARRQVIMPQLVHPGDVVRDIGQMLERLIGEDITLVMQIAPDVGSIWADRGQIEQVLMNMVVNARDAMPDGGTLTISVANAARPSPTRGTPPIPYVRLTIADTGVGMSDEVQQHLFEPFYTTKAPDQGTGLGLATCYGIVTQSGGEIAVASAVGAGATFTMLLPRAIDPSDADAFAQELAGPHGGGETVLLVEDDPFVREVVARGARAHNYRVLEAANADAALALARQHPGQIHALVADMGLPHMNGAALALELRRSAPAMRVLLISGYAEYGRLTMEGPVSGAVFLSKPFTPAALAAKLHVVLGTTPDNNGFE